MPHGKLEVYVEGAVGIKDTALLGKGSPYCTLTMGTQVYSSPPVEEGGTHPYFNTKFEFNVDSSTQELMVAMYSKKSLTDDDLLGYCTIFFKDAFYHSHVVPVTPYALTRPSGRPGGHVRLSLTFNAQPRQRAPPPGGYAPPQPRPAPYRQPRPLGPPPASYAPPRGPPSAGPYRQPRPPHAGPHQAPYPPQASYPPQAPYPPQEPYPPQHAQYAEPRRMDEEAESSSESSDSDADNGPPGPYQQYGTQGRGGVPPFRGGPRPRAPGPYMNQGVGRPAPPPPQQPGYNNMMGSVLQSVGEMVVGAAVGSMLGSDNDGSDWGGGDDVDGSFGNVETTSFGTLEDGGYYEESGAVVESGYESSEERYTYGESSIEDAAGAPGGGYVQPVQYAPPVLGAPGRGRAGPPPGRARGGPPGRGRAGRAPMRGRGPIARGGGGGPPPMRGRGPPSGY